MWVNTISIYIFVLEVLSIAEKLMNWDAIIIIQCMDFDSVRAFREKPIDNKIVTLDDWL